MTLLRVGIVGGGMIAGCPVRAGKPIAGTHAAAIRALDGVDLLAVVEPNAERRSAFVDHWSVPHSFESTESMLAAMEIDIVIVASPAETHEVVCMAALAHNVKGILCEKPFTGTAAGAQRIVSACAIQGIPLVVNFSRRWDLAHQALAEMIDRGILGPILRVWGCYNGTLRGNGSHLIDTVRMLVPGEWRVEWTNSLAQGADDGPVECTLADANDTRWTVTNLLKADYFVFEIHLFGARGRARLTLQGNDIRIDLGEPSALFAGYSYLIERVLLPRNTMPTSHTRSLAALVDAVVLRKPLPVDANEHCDTLRLLEQIVERARTLRTNL